MTGIIDVRSLAWGDPGWDIAGLVTCYGDAFVVQVERNYPPVEGMKVRSRFYCRMFALMEAVFGAKHAELEALNDGFNALNKTI
ncbi:MAG: hypothetical protein AAFU71_08235 [Cyanobacteria bacterium J06632_22]